ncbi:MAG TPA: hypothetical protein VK422_16580 [Pyrinomonadaceae bacterium]|nr:hypothetical protein [Pyrinomonadaceae bacterium]
MRTTSPRPRHLRGHRFTPSLKSLKQACRLALCTALLCQSFIFAPARTLAAPVVQSGGPRNLEVEETTISSGALIDQEIQNSQNGKQTSGPDGPEAVLPVGPDDSISGEEPGPGAPGDSAAFDAINFDENANLTGFFQIPPDPAGAVGPGHLVNVVNSSIEIYTKNGVRQLRQSLKNFFASAPTPPQTGTFDPKVIYDQYLNRFVVLTMERIEAAGATPNQSRVYLAVSDDSDPNGTWFFNTLNTEETINGRQTWADFPGLTVDSEAVYFTTNQFAHNNQTQAGVFQGQRLWIMAKAPWYAGGAPVNTRYNPTALANAQPGTEGAVATTMQPTHMYGDTPGGLGTFLLAYGGLSDGTNNYVQVIRVDNPLAAPTFTVRFSIVGTRAADDATNLALPPAPQKGTNRTIATNDRRFSQHGVYRNGLIYCAAPVRPPTGPDANQATAHYFIINPVTIDNPAADPPPQDRGNIGAENIGAGTHTFFPSVAVDAVGNLAVGFAASGPTIYPGSYYTGRLAIDAPGATRPARALRQGVDYYVRAFSTSTSPTVTSRWGDYSGIWLDPSNEMDFYVYNEHALARGTILNSVGPHEDGRWGTAWGAFNAASLAVAPATALPGQLIISEMSPRGSIGPLDEFVEVYNNTDADHSVTAGDASGGYGIVAEDGVLRCTIPNGTTIPARGHFLCGGAQYSYGSEVGVDAFFSVGAPTYGDIGDSQGVALFNSATNFSLASRLDAFGYTTSAPLYREGSGYPVAVVVNAPHSYPRTQYSGYEKDSDSNSADFISVNSRLDICCDPQSALGMPGPQNLGSPRLRLGQHPVSLFDPNVGASTAPNRERSSIVVPNGQNGTLRFRRTITNNTASPVTRYKIRVVDISTLQSPTTPQPGRPTPCTAPCADLRVLSSSDEAAVATSTGPKPTSGTTLDFSGFQPLGGGYNSSLNVNQVPVAPGASVNVNMLVGIMRGGTARFFFFVEALP